MDKNECERGWKTKKKYNGTIIAISNRERVRRNLERESAWKDEIKTHNKS